MIKVRFYFNDGKGEFIEYAEDMEELSEFIVANQHISMGYDIIEEDSEY